MQAVSYMMYKIVTRKYYPTTVTLLLRQKEMTRKELASIILGIRHYEHYHLFKKFVVRGDHAS